MFGLGIWELIIILSIVVILFGAKRLPMIGDGVGKMISNFRSATKTEELESSATSTNTDTAAATKDQTSV